MAKHSHLHDPHSIDRKLVTVLGGSLMASILGTALSFRVESQSGRGVTGMDATVGLLGRWEKCAEQLFSYGSLH